MFVEFVVLVLQKSHGVVCLLYFCLFVVCWICVCCLLLVCLYKVMCFFCWVVVCFVVEDPHLGRSVRSSPD